MNRIGWKVASVRDRGASAVEYGLMLAAVAAVVVTIAFVLGTGVLGLFQTSNDCIAAGSASTC